MKIEQLRYFVTVARVKSINRAAEALHIAQPALSRHFQQLENELNVKLFNRNSRGTTLTKAGEELLTDAISLLDDFEEVRIRHTQTTSSIEGKVTVVMPVFIAKLLALPLVYEIERIAPGINLHIIDDTQSSLEDEHVKHLKNGWCDLVFSYVGNAVVGIKSVYFADEVFFLIFDSSNDDSYENEVALLRAFSNYPVYIPPYHAGIRGFLELKAQESSTRAFRVIIETEVPEFAQERGDFWLRINPNCFSIQLIDDFDTWEAIKHQIRSGPGYAIAPLSMALTDINTKELSCARIVQPDIKRDIHLLSRSGELNTLAVKTVIDTITKLSVSIVERGFWMFPMDSHPKDSELRMPNRNL